MPQLPVGSVADNTGAMTKIRPSGTETNVETIRDGLRTHLPALRREYGVRALGVFGSYVHGKQRAKSDIDLLVEFEEGSRMTLFRYVELEQRLTDILGRKVDLVMKTALKPEIGARILAEVVPV